MGEPNSPRNQIRRIGFVLIRISLPILLGFSITFAQTSTTSSAIPDVSPADNSSNSKTSKEKSAGQKTDSSQKKEKRGSLVIAPIPISSPAFGSGLLLVAGYVFKLRQDDDVSPPTSIGLAAVRTNNGTRGFALGGRSYFNENKYQTTLAIAAGRANLDFYGIGRRPGKPTVVVPLSLKGKIFFGEFMRNIGNSFFVGPRFQYRRLEAGLQSTPPLGGFVIPEIDIKSTSAALGFHVQRDSRDSTYYPTKGVLFDFTGDFFDQAFGSRRQYQTYRIAYNGFRELKPGQIFAYRGMACSANQSVPFYDLCLFGYNSDVRGYTTGQFQNRRMFAAQGEYRLELPKRLGLVGFAGFGGVARRWSEFRMDELLPGAGVGLRFKLDKKNHINYRIDFAVGREGHTLSIGVAEAF